jgi:hypothetical protein
MKTADYPGLPGSCFGVVSLLFTVTSCNIGKRMWWLDGVAKAISALAEMVSGN